MKATLLLLMYSAFLHVSDPAPEVVRVHKKAADIYEVIYAEKAEKAAIRIENERGVLIFSEILKDVNGFARPYNFKFLPEGMYTISITSGKRVFREVIEHRKEKNGSPMTVRVSPLSDNRYIVSVVHPEDKSAMIRIQDKDANVLYESDHKTDTHTIVQLFRIESPVDELTFEVISGNSYELVKF